MDKSKRDIIKLLSAMGVMGVSTPLSGFVSARSDFSLTDSMALKTVCPIGMGTWITFNVGRDPYLIKQRAAVLNRFFELGGNMVDSSPMYGSAEEVMGKCLSNSPLSNQLFSATKLWTSSATEGRAQYRESLRLWGVSRLGLLQIHNLVGWQKHLPFLADLKQDKEIGYIGVTTSHGRRHKELKTILETQDIDFVQLTYNVLDREADQYLLPIARERGIKVIANRPFQGGRIFNAVKNQSLPSWASEIGVSNWAQFFLRFIISHPAISYAIPATSKVIHMEENMGSVSLDRMPSERQRQQMVNYLKGF